MFRTGNGQINGNKEMKQQVRPTLISNKVTFGLKQAKKRNLENILFQHIVTLVAISYLLSFNFVHNLQSTLLPAVHFLEQAFAGADFSTEKFSAALSLISAALFQCPKIAKFSVAHFFKLSCDLRCSFSIAKSRKILRCSSSDI